MKKRAPKKLKLHRETLIHLNAVRAGEAHGVEESKPCTQVNSMCPIETCSCHDECTVEVL